MEAKNVATNLGIPCDLCNVEAVCHWVHLFEMPCSIGFFNKITALDARIHPLYMIPLLKRCHYLFLWSREYMQILRWYLLSQRMVCVRSAMGLWIHTSGRVEELQPSLLPGCPQPTADCGGQNKSVITAALHSYILGHFQRYHTQALLPQSTRVNLLSLSSRSDQLCSDQDCSVEYL